mgnify:FL=1
MKKKIIKDSIWVAFGQISSAIGTLIGIRLLTEFAPPDVFGSITLLLATANLALGTLFTPVMQAALKFYPQYKAENKQKSFRNTTFNLLVKRQLLLLLILTCAWPVLKYYQLVGLENFILLIVLFTLDGIRTFETVLLNASRRQQAYAFISLAESWGRPLLAIVMIYQYGANVQSVLLGYISVSALVILFFYLLGQPEGQIKQQKTGVEQNLKRDIIKYSFPLLPLATVGWLSGVGDRYIIAGILDMQQVGIYAAVYGLLNRPFMMLAGMVELTIRPLYYQAIAENQHAKARKLLTKWLLLVFVAAVTGWVIIVVFKEFWISLLLAKSYHTGVELMPWIAGGSVLLILSHVFEKVCYGYGRTGLILVGQTVGMVIGLLCAYFGVIYMGILGAAIAVPIYFCLQLLISIIMAKKVMHVVN